METKGTYNEPAYEMWLKMGHGNLGPGGGAGEPPGGGGTALTFKEPAGLSGHG